MTIIATNLLTGLAVDDIEKIRGKAETQRLGMIIDRSLLQEYSMTDFWFFKKMSRWIKKHGTLSYLLVKKTHGSRISGVGNHLARDIKIRDLENSVKNPLWVPQQDEDIVDLDMQEETRQQQDKMMKDVGSLRKDIEGMMEENEKLQEENVSMKSIMVENSAVLQKLAQKLL